MGLELRRWLAGFAVLAVLAVPTAVRGEDVLVLESGRTATGIIVEETADRIRLQVDGGSLWYPRSMIREIVRGPDTPPDDPQKGVAVETAREEHGLLYRDGVRIGVRSLKVVERAEDLQFEEEVVILGEAGAPNRYRHVVERCDRQFLPLSFQVRERVGDGEHELTSGRIQATTLLLDTVSHGRRRITTSTVPASGRFPLSAREFYLRESTALSGKFRAAIYDPSTGNWERVSYRDGGTRPLETPGSLARSEVVECRIVIRIVGDHEEREWIRPDLTAAVSELMGPVLRFLSVDRETCQRVLADAGADASGPDSAARTVYRDAEGGWTLGKPDPTWTFERPEVEGAGALLSVRCEPLSASVDLFEDPTAREDVTVERAAESLQRACRAVAPDFRVHEERYVDREDGGREYRMEATATTKGEKTRTLSRVILHRGRVWRLLAASPERWFALCRSDLERVLDSFRPVAAE